MDSRPHDWEWVSARAACSAAVKFVDLKKLAERDVATRNAQVGPQPPGTPQPGPAQRFRVEGTAVQFNVFDASGGDGVRFTLERDRIRVVPYLSGQEFVLTLVMTQEGRCKFEITGDQLDDWQVLRRYVEPVLFA